jgi:hypothetical protein
MSVTLLLKLQKIVDLKTLEVRSSEELRRILNLDKKPLVTAEIDKSDAVGVITDGFMDETSKRIIFSLAGFDEKVVAMPFTTPVQTKVNDNSYSFVDQNYISIEWYYKKSSLCCALIAAVALAIAGEVGSDIEDNSVFYTKEVIQHPDNFRDSVSLGEPYPNIESAVQAFYTKLPK